MTPSDAPAEVRIFVWEADAEHGPFPFSTIAKRVATGVLAQTVLSRTENGEWVPFNELASGLMVAHERDHPTAETVAPPRLQKTSKGYRPSPDMVAILIALAIVTLFLSFGAGLLNLPMPGRVWQASNVGAYEAAKGFIEDAVPGILKFAPLDRASISRDGPDWVVLLRVDGQNAFGGPVRRMMTVKMGATSSGFYLINVSQ